MQNRYVGDIGDFGKYGLLRALCGTAESPRHDRDLRLGVVWYLYPNESHNSDGKYTNYLADTQANHSSFRVCDPPLYDALDRLITTNNRNVIGVRQSQLLPENTAYYERSLSYEPGTPRAARLETRNAWIDGALEATKEADVVFVDPDNGISTTVDPLSKTGPKFVFIDDLQRFTGRDQSLVIYHHMSRRGTAAEQIRHFSACLQQSLDLSRPPWALWYHRGTARAYFIIAQDRHAAVVESKIAAFLAGPWRGHFELVDHA